MGRGLGHKQQQVLELAAEHSKISPTGKAQRICGTKADAKRVLKTLQSRGLLDFEGYGYWSITDEGRSEVEEIEAV